MANSQDGGIQVVETGGLRRQPTHLIINNHICKIFQLQKILRGILVRTLLGLFLLKRDETGWSVKEIEGLQALSRRG